jgi:hypothetical protein
LKPSPTLGTIATELTTLFDAAKRVDEYARELLAQPVHIEISDEIGADFERIDASGHGAQRGAVWCRRTAEHRNHGRARGRPWRHLAADSSFIAPITFC